MAGFGKLGQAIVEMLRGFKCAEVKVYDSNPDVAAATARGSLHYINTR
jgi:phosphoglycerate dehydrogenase-like enzyme